MLPTRVLRSSDIAMWSAGIDWCRVTLNVDTAQALGSAKEAYRAAALRSAHDAGFTGSGKPWSFRGYQGAEYGSIRWGESYYSGLMLDASGWQSEYAASYPIPWTNVARLDIQVTLWLVTDIPALGERVAEASDAARREVSHRPWKIRHIQGLGDGDTVYLGVRKDSPIFIRAYDKMREEMARAADDKARAAAAELWRNAWRFEVELKEGEGVGIYESLRYMTQRHISVGAMVYDYLFRRGVELPKINGGAVYKPLRELPTVSDVDKKLAWLNRQVAPAIDKLLANGVQLEVITSALELPTH